MRLHTHVGIEIFDNVWKREAIKQVTGSRIDV